MEVYYTCKTVQWSRCPLFSSRENPGPGPGAGHRSRLPDIFWPGEKTRILVSRSLQGRRSGTCPASPTTYMRQFLEWFLRQRSV